MPRVLIVPGLHDSGPGHWQTEWQRHLRHVRRIDVADWSTPNLQAWTDAIDRAIDDFAPTHIVAHSFGTLASAVVAARRGDGLRGLLLVAPADPNKFGIAAQMPQQELPVDGVLVGSLSDPWFDWGNAQALGEQWGLQTVCAGDAGHINVQSGHGQWPQGWLILQRQLQQYAPTHQFLREQKSLQKFFRPKLSFAF